MGAKSLGQVIVDREAVVARICRERGWDRDELSMDQILAIRATPEWQQAGK